MLPKVTVRVHLHKLIARQINKRNYLYWIVLRQNNRLRSSKSASTILMATSLRPCCDNTEAVVPFQFNISSHRTSRCLSSYLLLHPPLHDAKYHSAQFRKSNAPRVTDKPRRGTNMRHSVRSRQQPLRHAAAVAPRVWPHEHLTKLRRRHAA
jgi:hypothetical protein